MKFLHRTKDSHGRSTPLPSLLNPLSSSEPGATVGMLRVQTGSGVDESAAMRRLNLRGYRIYSGALWYIQNDDPEDFNEVLIANWDGRAQDAENALEAHGWPTSPWIMCACGEGEAELGGECVFCARESVEWTRAGEYM